MSDRWKQYWPWAVLVAVTVAVYVRVPEFGLMVGWDDELYLLRRPEVVDWFGASWWQRLATPSLGYPVPLPTFVHYLVRQLPADWVLPFNHLVNLAFHLTNVCLAYLLARRWLDDERAALACTALWAAHPLLVESVAWLANLKGLMFATSALASIWLWERHLDEPSWGRSTAIAGAFVVALGCRPDAIVLGPIWIGQTLLRDPARLHDPRRWGPLAVAVVGSAAYLPIAVAGQQAVVASENLGSGLNVGFGERLRRIFSGLTLQLEHAVYPLGLQPDYPADYPGAARDAWIGVGLFVLLIAATVGSWRRAGTSDRGWLVWWMFYAPVSGLVVLPRFTADAYMYLPLFGLLVAAVGGVSRVLSRSEVRVRRGLKRASVVGLVAALGLAAHVQTLRWRNIVALWRPVMRAQPSNIKAKWMVASGYVRAEAYEKALAIYRPAYSAFVAAGRIPFRMVVALERTGRHRRAVEVAARMMTYEGKTSSEVERFLVRTVVEHELSVEPGGALAPVLGRAAETVLEEKGGFEAAFCRRAVEHFADEGLADLARRFRRCSAPASP
ncbi:MAG: hypothetical protein ABEL76_11765 [Bradymonadaceae bacterium]